MKHRWKRSGVMALVLFLCLLMVLPAFASESGSSETEQPYSTRYWRLSDATETISEADQKAFDERAMEAVTHYQFDFVFAIIPEEELGEDSLEEYTDWFYHENGFGYGKQQEGVVCLIMANQDAQPNQCNVMGVGPLGEELFPTEKCETLRDVILQTVKAEGQLSKGYVEGADIFLRKTTWELRLHSASAQAKEIVDKTFPYANQEKPDWFPEDWAEFKCYYDPAAPQLTDAAGIFSGEEANTICEKLRALRKKYGTDFVVFTDRSTHGLSRGVYAADFF